MTDKCATCKFYKPDFDGSRSGWCGIEMPAWMDSERLRRSDFHWRDLGQNVLAIDSCSFHREREQETQP